MKIFSKIRGPVRQILSDLKSEDEVAQAITYKAYASQTIVAGKPKNNYDSYSITAIRLRHSEKSAKSAGSQEIEIQQGDVVYMIDARDFPTTYGLRDLIVSGTREEKVKAITPVFDLLFLVTVDSGGS